MLRFLAVLQLSAGASDAATIEKKHERLDICLKALYRFHDRGHTRLISIVWRSGDASAVLHDSNKRLPALLRHVTLRELSFDLDRTVHIYRSPVLYFVEYAFFGINFEPNGILLSNFNLT
jgi:hypothetical protein